jgi:transposase
MVINCKKVGLAKFQVETQINLETWRIYDRRATCRPAAASVSVVKTSTKFRKMTKKQISDKIRMEIVHLHSIGKAACTIARQFNVSVSTVYRIAERYKKEGNSDHKPRPKNGQKVTPSMEQIIVRTALAYPEETRQKVRDLSCLPLSRVTVANVLKKRGIERRAKARKPQISKNNREKRLTFAKQHLEKTPSEWTHFAFSDESKIVVPRGTHVLRRKGQRLCQKNIIPTKQYEEAEMVWACFTRRKLGPIVFCKDYKTKGNRGINGSDYAEILRKVGLPFLRTMRGSGPVTFQQDNAPIHKIQKVQFQFCNFSGFCFFSILNCRSRTSSGRAASKRWTGRPNRLT